MGCEVRHAVRYVLRFRDTHIQQQFIFLLLNLSTFKGAFAADVFSYVFGIQGYIKVPKQ